MTKTMKKKSRIAAVFAALKERGGKAFIPYIMAGDPDLDLTLEHVLLLERCGADIVELGVPFSDPLADGPTIQAAAGRALKAGVTLRKVISFARDLRRHTAIPLVLMTYYNPVFKYGEEAFMRDAAEAGVDGLIIPDLPPDEAKTLRALSRKLGVPDTIFLVAPTSTPERIRLVTAACGGFVYYVSMTGITGSQLSIGEDLRNHLALVRQATNKPTAIGFGVSTSDQARALREIADGIIVGSAIVKIFHERPADAERYIRELREAI